MEFPKQFKHAMKLVLELEWLQVIIKKPLLQLLNKLEFWLKIGYNLKETVQLCKVNNLENLLEVWLTKVHKIKPLEIFKISKL